MKRVLIIALFFVSLHSIAQNTFVGVNTFNDTIKAPNVIRRVTDTTNLKVAVFDASGNLFKSYWPSTGITGITADNGLTASTSTNVQLGGTLLQNTSIAASTYALTLTGSGDDVLVIDGTGADIFSNCIDVTDSSSASTIFATNKGLSSAVFAKNTNATGGDALAATSTAGIAIDAQSLGTNYVGSFAMVNSTTNAVNNVLLLNHQTTGTAASGFGLGVIMSLENAGGSQVTSNSIVSKLTTATNGSETSQFSITGINSGATQDILKIGGGGVITYTADINVAAGTTTTNLSLANSARVFISQCTGIPTYTLPSVTSNNGVEFVFKNCGTVNMVINSNAGGNDIFTTTAVSTVTLAVGETLVVVGTGAYWAKIN